MRKNHVEPHRLIQDDDSHWYVIKVCDAAQFELWCAAMAECTPWEGHDFNTNRVNSPADIWFNSWDDRT